jgi:outer membrane protein
MRTVFAFSMVGVMLLLVAARAAQQPQKFAYVDSRRIIADDAGVKAAQTQAEREMQVFQRKAEALRDSSTKMVEDYQRRSLTMSPDAKRAEEARLSAKAREFEARLNSLQVEADQKGNDIMKPAMDKVDNAIDAVRKEGGYAIIFDAGRGAMVSADTTLDLTKLVLAKLKGPAAPPRSGGGGR